MGGSYAVEALTDQLEGKILGYLKRIEEMGGMLKAMELGFPQAEIQEAAYRTQKEMESGERKWVGVNAFASESDGSGRQRILKVSPGLELKQRKKLRDFLKKRDAVRSGGALEEVQDAARKPRENLFPYILKAVESSATLGEICRALSSVFGRGSPEGRTQGAVLRLQAGQSCGFKRGRP